MTDDPWARQGQPDPNAPPPYPYQYPNPYPGPQPGGYPQPYQNPYQQGSLPKRGGVKRLLIIISALGLLLLGGCGVGIYYLVNYLGKNADAVNAFLADVRGRQFQEAYSRLCPPQQAEQSSVTFAAALQAAAARGHAVTSYDITTVDTSSSNGFSTRTAGGTVNFGDGSSQTITFTLGKTGSRLCISGGYQLLQ